jgi:uncharacterized membrane protein
VHPPLYFLMLRFWRMLFGSSEFATRSLSAAAGILGALIIYDVGRLAHGPVAGLWAAAIMAAAGPQIEFAQDARAYTLVTLLALCMLDAIVRIEIRGANWRRLVGLATAALGAMLTHYFAIPLTAAMGIYIAIRWRGGLRRQGLVALATAAIIFAGVWGPFLWNQRPNVGPGQQGFLFEGPWSRWYAVQQLAALPIKLLGPPVTRSITSAWPAAVCYVLPLLLLRKNRFLLLWLFWLIGTAIVLASLDQFRASHHLSFTRYLVLCGPGFYLIFAGVLANEKTRWLRHVVPALAVIFCLLSLRSSYAQWRWPDWRTIAGQIDRMKRPNDLLVFSSDDKQDWFTGDYMSYAFYARQKPTNVLLLVRPADAALLRKIDRFSGVVIVNGTNRAPETSLPGYHVVRAAGFRLFITMDRMKR